MRGSLATTSAMILCLFLSISVKSMKQQTIQRQESLRGLIPIAKKQLAPDREQTLLISNLSSELIELKELVMTTTTPSQPAPPPSPFDGKNGPLSIASWSSIIWLPLPVLGRSRCSAHAIINTLKIIIPCDTIVSKAICTVIKATLCHSKLSNYFTM